jgi:hypothetical protein
VRGAEFFPLVTALQRKFLHLRSLTAPPSCGTTVFTRDIIWDYERRASRMTRQPRPRNTTDAQPARPHAHPALSHLSPLPPSTRPSSAQHVRTVISWNQVDVSNSAVRGTSFRRALDAMGRASVSDRLFPFLFPWSPNTWKCHPSPIAHFQRIFEIPCL